MDYDAVEIQICFRATNETPHENGNERIVVENKHKCMAIKSGEW